MTFVKWKDEYVMGFKQIDSQHKQLVDLINKAYDTHSQGDIQKNKEKGNEIFSEFIGFARVHFSTEEKYFEKFNYEKKEEHMLKHMNLTEKVLEIKENYDKNKCDCKAFLGFLKEWIENHLKVMDQKYVKCFKEHGLR